VGTKRAGKQIIDIIRTHREKGRGERRDWDKYRSWYLSESWRAHEDLPTGAGDQTDEDELNLEANYPYAYIDTMIANVCPTNPQVTVTARREEKREIARFREALINETYRLNQTHKKLWKLATNTALCGRGILKTVWDFKKQRPEFRIIDPRHFMFDMSVDWEDMRYCIEVTVLTKGQFHKRIKKQKRKGGTYNKKVAEKAKFASYPGWLQDQRRDRSMIHGASKEVFDWVVVYEFYDFEHSEYSHWIDDMETPLFTGKLPYRFLKNPFRMLTFNDNMTDTGGVSDIKLIANAYERLNEIDTLELWHAHASNPVTLINESMVDNTEDLKSALIQANLPGAMVGIQGKHKAPLRDLIGQTPTPQISPSFAKMRERCIHIIEFTLGIPAYSRGVVGVADVATEVALADTATRTRNGRRIKAVQDIVSWLATSAMSLYEEYLPADTELPLRLTDSQSVLLITREALKTRDPNKESVESIFDYDYDAVAYSPTENHRLLQLQKIQQYMDLLLQSPAVDQEKLMTKLLDLLGLSEIQQRGGPQPAAAPGMPPGMPAPPPGQDTLATGALPPGLEVPLPPSPGGGAGAGFAGAAQGLQAGMKGLG